MTKARAGALLAPERLREVAPAGDEAAEELGIRVMLIHAKQEQARRWYERFGFEESPTEPLHLMLLMKDLRTFLASVSKR